VGERDHMVSTLRSIADTNWTLGRIRRHRRGTSGPRICTPIGSSASAPSGSSAKVTLVPLEVFRSVKDSDCARASAQAVKMQIPVKTAIDFMIGAPFDP
jgi:hypothetical protein